MSALTYVGRTPDSDGIIVPKSYADTQNAALAVTTAYVNAQIASAVAGTNPAGGMPTSALVLQNYVDASFATVAKIAAYQAADATYIAASQLGAASGVASLNSSGNLTATQVPSSGLVTDRITQCYSVANPGTLTNILGGTASSVTGAIGTMLFTSPVTVTGTTVGGSGTTKLASIVIPDPGWPWRPMPYAWVQGSSSNGTNDPGLRMQGTGNYGMLTVIPLSSVSTTTYGRGVCSGSYYTNTHRLLPYAGANQTPSSVPAINGGLELDLWGSCWSGTTFTFQPTNFVFFILVVPAI